MCASATCGTSTLHHSATTARTHARGFFVFSFLSRITGVRFIFGQHTKYVSKSIYESYRILWPLSGRRDIYNILNDDD